MTPESVDPSRYLPSSAQKIGKRRMPMCAHLLAKKPAIISKTSLSPEVSPSPGISMRATLLSSRVNSSAGWTSAVLGPRRLPTGSLEPLARLINWRKRLVPGHCSGTCPAYRCLPASSRPRDTVATIRVHFNRRADSRVHTRSRWVGHPGEELTGGCSYWSPTEAEGCEEDQPS